MISYEINSPNGEVPMSQLGIGHVKRFYKILLNSKRLFIFKHLSCIIRFEFVCRKEPALVMGRAPNALELESALADVQRTHDVKFKIFLENSYLKIFSRSRDFLYKCRIVTFKL